jgi:CDP-diacylglycerol--glycerol-3-phosphate 3-phosphatidyltransferase
MLAVVVVVLGFQLGPRTGLSDRTVCMVVALFYLAAALSDLLDGYLARRYGNESNLGRFLDPMADKLLVGSALIMLIPLGRVPAWVAFLIIAREMAVTGLRAIAAEQGLVIAASPQGKQKTFAQNTALFCLLWNYELLWADTHRVGTVMVFVALAATYWSAVLYFHQFLKAAAGGAEGVPAHFKPAASARNSAGAGPGSNAEKAGGGNAAQVGAARDVPPEGSGAPEGTGTAEASPGLDKA